MNDERLKPLLLRIRTMLQCCLAPLRLRPSRILAGQRIFFDPATDIGLELFLTGQFENHAIVQCARFIAPDGVVIDVGANIGVHTVHFATFATDGYVVSLEPSQSTFGYLLRNIRNLPNVVPLNIGFADRAGLREFFVATDNAYSGLKDTGRKSVLRKETIACYRGDEILPNLVANRRIDLIKIDVEGLELEVLMGLRTVISIHRPVIFCEIFAGQKSNLNPTATVQFCVSLGYEAFVLIDRKLVPAKTHTDQQYNYFFLPSMR